MQNYGSDDEQLDAIKHWWDENGKSVIAGVALAAAALVGWTGYGEWKERTLGNAALAWHELELAVKAGNDSAFEKAEELASRYKRTPYADLARLMQARIALDQGDDQRAMDTLSRLAGDVRQVELRPIAQLRLAALQWEAGDADAALATLSTEPPAAFVTQFEELRGDILRDQGDLAAAREAYELALAAATPEADTSLLVLKRNDLPAI